MNNLKKNIKKFSKSFSPLLIPYALVMFFLIIVPIIFICLYAIIAPTNNSLSFTVNLHKFVEFFSNQSFVVLPFMILPIFNSLEKINKSYLQASKDLGASWWTMFYTIILRKSLPGILTGSVFVIIQSSTSLIIVHYLGLSNVNLIVSVAQSYFFNSGDFSYGSVIALILMFFIIILLIMNKLIFKFIIKDKKNKNKVSMSNEKIF